MRGWNRPTAESRFATFETYLHGRLDATSGPATGSELTGNCRLSWYDHLLRNPLSAAGEAEEFTRLLHKAIARRSGRPGRRAAHRLREARPGAPQTRGRSCL